MPQPSFSEAAIPRARWLLLLPSCLPGGLMLWLEWRCDLLGRGQDSAPELQDFYAHARRQADQLYTAGTVALAGGLLMTAFIAWKILRPAPPEEAADVPAAR